MQTAEASGSAPRTFARLIALGLVFNALIILPAWWREGDIGVVWLAPEAWVVPALGALLPRGLVGSILRGVLGAALAFALIAGIFDALVQSVLGRPLNVFIDPLMLRAGFHLIEGSAGIAAATLASVLAAAAAAGIAWAAVKSLRRGAARPALIILTAGLVLGLPPLEDGLPGVSTQFPEFAAVQLDALEQTRLDRRALIAAQNDAAFEPRPLPGLAGRDVYIVFLESYGASLVGQKRFAGSLQPRLERWSDRLAHGGLSAVSATLEAPIRGGQSWLSHATVLSGLPIDNQLWYRMLLARDIGLLTGDFRATGHETVNVAPAIVREWPEAKRLGFDRVYTAAELDYAGPALGWVTMPDQFTLHAMTRKLQAEAEGPVFVQVALISSHWPWRPVVDLLEPGQLEDGRIFESWAGEDINAFSLMFQPRLVREAFQRSIGYSVDATFDWALRSLPRDALLIVLGDHQPVSLVTGRGVGNAVPVHVISGDDRLLEGFRRRGFGPGLWPVLEDEPPSLGRLRHWLRQDFAASSPRQRPDGQDAQSDLP